MRYPLWCLILFFFCFSCAHQSGAKSGETSQAVYLLPDSLPQWTRVGPLWEAHTAEELYRRINGGATIFMNYGFQSYAGQIYHNKEGIEVEVGIYLLNEKEKARQLFNDPLMKPRLSKRLKNLGEDARVDESPLFHNIVEIISPPFFIRIIVQDKSNSSVQIAGEFAQHILQKINKNI